MMMISIEQLKPICAKVIAELKRDKEPLDAMKDAIKIVDQVLDQKATFPDPNTSHYFYTDFLGEIARLALKSNYYKNKDVILLVYVYRWLRLFWTCALR